MASSKLRTDASSSGDLPPDALFEILLRVPAKDLCRLRAVCRAWRALTYGPLFVAAHKSRHKAPLLALAYHDHDNNVAGVDIMDLSGNLLRRIPIVQDSIPIRSSGLHTRAPRTHLDLICLHTNLFFDLWLLNPATGAFLTLPAACQSEELRHARKARGRRTVVSGFICFWEGLVLRTVQGAPHHQKLKLKPKQTGPKVGDAGRQLCEVNTLDGANHGGWRGKQAPPFHIASSHDMKCAVVDDVVYFLVDILYSVPVEPLSIAAFNLETEEWMVTLHGPAAVLTFIQDSPYYGRFPYLFLRRGLSLAELNGCLVTVHNIESISTDLWFLTDFERGIWEKKYSMPPQIGKPGLYPFLVSDDWVILYSGCQGQFVREKSFLQKYDRRTGIYSDMLKLRESSFIAVYNGSPLSF